MPNLHLLTQTFSQARHASGTQQFNGLEPPLTQVHLANGHTAFGIRVAEISFKSAPRKSKYGLCLIWTSGWGDR